MRDRRIVLKQLKPPAASSAPLPCRLLSWRTRRRLLAKGRPPRVLISERGLFRPLFDLAKWVKTMEGRVEVSSDAVCQGSGAYLEAHAPAALLAKIYLSMLSFCFLGTAPAQDLALRPV